MVILTLVLITRQQGYRVKSPVFVEAAVGVKGGCKEARTIQAFLFLSKHSASAPNMGQSNMVPDSGADSPTRERARFLFSGVVGGGSYCLTKRKETFIS
jgi:hypothetical protein